MEDSFPTASYAAEDWSSTTIDGLNLFDLDDHQLESLHVHAASRLDDLDDLATSGGNPWLPAYGFQQPHTLLDKDDFIGNPADAELFLQSGNHYVYLETIQEETSDDLRSDSDFSDSRASPVGWLATDSESGSVIRMQTLDDAECESDREVACPAKRRRQEPMSDDESSISRSSSLLQFESLEKQCQDISSSSPSIFSNFSYDSLERKVCRNVSPDSLERAHSDEESSDYYKVLKIDLLPKKKRQSRDSLLYDNSAHSSSSSSSGSGSDSADSEETLEAARYDSTKSVNLKTWRSFDGLHTSINSSINGAMKTVKISSENLSEDSGYSDNFYNTKVKSSSIPNMAVQHEKIFLTTDMKDTFLIKENKNIYKTRVEIRQADDALEKYRLKNVGDAFDAYDGDVFHTFTGNFGVSYHDLSMVDQYEHRSPLIDRFMRNGANKRRGNIGCSNVMGDADIVDIVECLNLDNTTTQSETLEECGKFSTISTTASASEPNLLSTASCNDADEGASCDDLHYSRGVKIASFDNSVCVSSVPKDLNLAGDIFQSTTPHSSLNNTSNQTDSWKSEQRTSIAAVNCDLADLDTTDSNMPKLSRYQRAEYGDKITIRLKYDTSSMSSASDIEGTSSFKREGSYLEAMTHAIDMSDDEAKKQKKSLTVHKFDRDALKAISETSIQSLGAKSIEQLNTVPSGFTSTPIHNRNVISTPNLANLENDFVPTTHVRKSSLINRSTSTTEVSDNEDKKLNVSKSLTGSSKGVHFSPVIAEVNWRDDSVSTNTEREGSSCNSTPEREIMVPPPRRLFSRSQPELHHRQRVPSSDDDSTDDCMKPAVSEELMRRRQVPLDSKRKSAEVIITTHHHDHTTNHQQQQHSPSSCTSSRSSHVPFECIEERHWHTKSDNRKQQNKHEQTVVVMESVGAHQQRAGAGVVGANDAVVTTKNRMSGRGGGIGGFFSRIASFRFSTRAAKNDEKKKQRQTQSLKDTAINNKQQPHQITGQRLATKDDYIYIPLKGPDVINNIQLQPFSKIQVDGILLDNDSNNLMGMGTTTTCVSAKPPLPKMPPRVVGACVKRRPDIISAAAASMTTAAAQPASYERRTIDSGLPRPMEPMGLIETDLDTEVTVITNGAHVKTRSLMNLGHEAPTTSSLKAPKPHHHHHHDAGRPHKSMEFLLDKQNLKVVEPPENELQKGGERVMSEHEIRVQRSLQKLNVPEWYKQAQIPREGFLLKNKGTSGVGRESRWQGTGSKTTSLSSLGSNTQSPVMLSPTTLHTQPFVRWSTSKLNSTASSPCASTRSSFNARQPNGSISPSSLRSSFNYRQPYLGWRSQERLSRPRTPAERLASSILSQASHAPPQPQESPEIQTSIKEVTSAIVHYVSGLRPDSGREHSYDSQETASQRSRSVSPRGSQKLCWLESSFVGTRPLDSPQTPITLTESPTPMNNNMPMPPTTLRLDLQTHNDSNALSTGGSRRPSPSSTTLEDVLDSLLGLPSSTRAPSPSLQGTASANTSPIRRQGEHTRVSEQYRRRSEGSEPASRPSSDSHRASLHSSPILRCRNSRCGRSATSKSPEAQQFKSCHNCSYTYCSRNCRREHWEKHRKTCLFSRVGSLCRQVIAAAKEQQATLHNLSMIARRGYLSQGQGAVKIFFPCPEAAEKFLSNGLESLGDPTYVRWADLLPSEMGPQLYAELVKMCKHYNPDGKLVLYVSVCVVSEAPAAGAVKWERQLVSRCGKLRLSKNLHVPDRDVEQSEAIILTSKPIRQEPIQRLREIGFNNIQRHLQQRGVSLKRQYPDIYQQLSSYVAGRRNKFTPVTVYPKDTNTGKPFMCIIMPDVEPECVEQVTTAGVRVRTVDVLDDELVLDNT